MPTLTASSETIGIRSSPPGPAAGIGRPNRAATFLNVDDDLGFAQLLGQPFILAAELLFHPRADGA
ncbi:MAG: hypothetical protein IPJ98_19125 [Bryobacterales bacterium]|nr:hypothetical protein [Bryobacterales bacterium]